MVSSSTASPAALDLSVYRPHNASTIHSGGHMRIRHCLAAFMALVLSLTLEVASSSPAHAADNQRWSTPMSQGFVKTGMIRFYTPNICVHYRLDGVLNYTANITHTYDSNIDTWLYQQYINHVSFTTMSLTVDGYRPSGSSCTSTRKSWSQAILKLGARGYSCDFNPSVSVSFPWTIGVAAWPSCGNRSLGRFKSSLTGSEYHHRMVRSASYDKIVFDKGYTFSQARPHSTSVRNDIAWHCYGLDARVWLSQTNVGDDERPTRRAAACPGWTGGWSIFGGVTPVRIP